MSARKKQAARPKIVEDVAELDSNVCVITKGQQADHHARTTEAMADCVGKECGMAVRSSVKLQKESLPNEPDEPLRTAATAEIEKWKKQLDRHCKKVEEHEENKGKAFVVIKGQCAMAMRNKPEAQEKCQDVESDCNVMELLKIIGGLMCELDVQHNHKSMALVLRRLLTVQQRECKSVPGCCK